MKLGSFVVMFLCMVMFLEFVGIPTGASTILGSFGIDINSNTGELISADGEQSDFWGWIFGDVAGILVVLGLGGVIVIGIFGKSIDPVYIMLPFLVSIGTLLSSTVWTIIKYMSDFQQAWATNIVALIMAGIGIAFIMSCVDYFTGR